MHMQYVFSTFISLCNLSLFHISILGWGVVISILGWGWLVLKPGFSTDVLLAILKVNLYDIYQFSKKR